MSEELTDINDLPIVALLEAPFHDKTEEEQRALVERLRELRTNASQARATRKKASDKLAGKTPKNKPSFDVMSLLD